MACMINQLVNKFANRPKKQQQNRQRQNARIFALAHRQENHGKNILHHQNANGHFAIKRAHIAFIFENFDGKDGAGKRQAKGQNHRRDG